MMPKIYKGDEAMTKTVKLNRNCQFCNRPTPAAWDAKHRQGPWAYFCEQHFKLLAHPGFAGAATKLEREDEPKVTDADIEVFEAPGVPKGSQRYFELAIEAGFFGCDDDETFAFKPKANA